MFQPILADTYEEHPKVQWPLWCTPKHDGVRGLVVGGQLVSRKLEPIPNKQIAARISLLGDGVDGEIVTYTDDKPDDYNTVQSKVMSEEGNPEFTYHVFDYFMEPELPYFERVGIIQRIGQVYSHLDWIRVDNPEIVHSHETAREYHDWLVKHGCEGIILRNPKLPYLHGRSCQFYRGTFVGGMLKMVDYSTDEGTLVGLKQKFTNTNPMERSKTGSAKRSSAKAGKVPVEAAGALEISWNGLRFNLTCADHDLAAEYWRRGESAFGAKITFKYRGVGTNGKPRFASFLGERKDI